MADALPLETDVQTVLASGAPAKQRIATVDAAIAIFQRAKNFDETYNAVRRASIAGMIDGNPPYDPAVIEELGLGDMTNVNFGGMAAKLDQRAAAAHELYAETPTLIELEQKKPDLKDRMSADWGMIIAEEFTRLVYDEPSFLVSQDLVFRDSDRYGIGFCTFNGPYDFIPKAHHRGTLLIDEQGSVELDKNECFMLRDTMTAGELFELMEKGEAAEKAGWNLNAIKSTLIRVFLEGSNGNNDEKYQRSTWEEFVQRARNCDASYQAKQFESVRVIHYLSKEVSGGQKISCQILAESAVAGGTTQKSKPDPNAAPEEFLYKGLGMYGHMHEAIWWLCANYGDGYAHSVRGIASRMFKHEDLGNRFLGSSFDAGFLRGSFVMQSATQLDQSKMQLIRHGPLTILPVGLQAVQSSFQPDVGTGIELRRVSESIMENNTGLTHRYPESLTADTESRKTARQVVEESSKEARMEKAAVAMRYNQYEQLYREMFRRLTRKEYLENVDKSLPRLEAALEFVDRCKARGVPLSEIKDGYKKWRVTASRAIGLGSYGVKMDIANQFMNKYPFLSDHGRYHTKRFWAATLVGYKNVDHFVEPLQLSNIPTQEMSFAVVENGLLADGKAVLATGDQMHEIHVQQHVTGVVIPIIQGVSQNQVGDPERALRALQAGIQHVIAHVKYWEGQPGMKPKIAELQKLVSAAGGAMQKLKQMVVERQKAMQRQQQQVQKEQIEAQRDYMLATAERDHLMRKDQLSADEQRSLNAMRAQKTMEQNRIKAVGAQHDMDLRASELAHRLQMDAAKTQADIEMDRLAETGQPQ